MRYLTWDVKQATNNCGQAADKVKREVGKIDILVNNAGIVTGKKFLECDDRLIEKTMEVNANAHFWVGCLVSFASSVFCLCVSFFVCSSLSVDVSVSSDCVSLSVSVPFCLLMSVCRLTVCLFLCLFLSVC